jgi:calcineurin-like phosphoesterase family protein
MKIAFISDIHEDVVSLRIALSNIEKLACDKIVCLGDISGFSPFYYSYHNERNARECIKMIRQNCDIIIPGNHDYFASESLPQLSSGFDFPENWYDLDYYQKKSIAGSKLWDYESSALSPKLSHEDKAFLSSLQQFQTLKSDPAEIMLSHYIYPNLSGMETSYCKNISDYRRHFDFMAKHNANISVVGHAHPSKLYYIDRKKINKKNFGKTIECDKELIILCPAIARGASKQAFLIIDTLDNTIYTKRF